MRRILRYSAWRRVVVPCRSPLDGRRSRSERRRCGGAIRRTGTKPQRHRNSREVEPLAGAPVLATNTMRLGFVLRCRPTIPIALLLDTPKEPLDLGALRRARG